jgi:tetratricopeptide (TPR) repeat protein
MVNSMAAAERKVQFDNLVTILTLAAILALFGLVAKFTTQNASGDLTAYQASKKIVGYVKPQSATPAKQEDYHAAFKNATMPKSEDLKVTMSPQDAALLKQRFNQAVALLHAKQYQYAIMALNQVIKLQPKLPEAYVNIGFAYLGLEDWDTAKIAFNKAMDLKPDQANAYYGLALSYEGKKDYEAALGAMRSYIHLSTPKDPFLAKARSALWEWEAQLGRIPGAKKTLEDKKPVAAEEGSPHNSAE